MKKKENSQKTLEEALIDLYLNVKIRKQEEIENFNNEMLSDEREKLRKTNSLTIIDYIKNSIDILIDLKVEEKLEAIKKLNLSGEEEKQNEYETLLRKLESDIRLHIKIEHQLKLHSEALQQKIEDLEKDNEENNNTKNKNLNEEKKDEEIQNLKNSVNNLKQILKSYEEQSLKMSDLEKKLRIQNVKHEKELKLIEDKYAEKIKILNRKISNYEETLKINNFAYKSFNKEDEEMAKINSLMMNDQICESKNNGRSPLSSSIDRKKDLDDFKQKNDNLKKIIDNKLTELANANSIINKSLMKKNTLNSNYDRTTTNKSYIHEEKASMNESSKSYLKNDSFAKSISNNAKKSINKENFKSHMKTYSVEIKTEKSKSPAPGIKSNNNVRDILINNQNQNLANSQNILSNLSKNSLSNNNTNLIHHHSNYKTTKSANFNNNSNNNAIVNKGNLINNNNVSSNNLNNNFNNLNSYTTNGNVKSEINLRNYIMNRVNKSNAKPGTSQGRNNNALIGKITSGPGHFRSNSNNIFA